MSTIITIGREFGSGGREIGRRLAEKLGVAYYDQEIVDELARRTNLAEDYIRSVEENRPLPLLPIHTARTFSFTDPVYVEQKLSVYNQESKLIKELAERSPCIIVGRCADYILREMKPFRLFIYADMEAKMERCRRRGEDTSRMTDRDLQQKITAVTKKRARYYQFYTDQVWGDKANYDLCVNTSGIDIKRLAENLANFISIFP